MTGRLPTGLHPFRVDSIEVIFMPATLNRPDHDMTRVNITIFNDDYTTQRWFIDLHQLMSYIAFIKAFALNVDIIKAGEPFAMSKILDSVGCFGCAEFDSKGNVKEFISLDGWEEIS